MVVRLGVTKAALDRAGEDRCSEIGKLIAGGYKGEELVEPEEDETNTLGLSVLYYDIHDGKLIEILMGTSDDEPWIEDECGPEPRYDKIDKWFEL